MSMPAHLAAAMLLVLVGLHVVTIMVAGFRLLRNSASAPVKREPASVIVPVSGLDQRDVPTLQSALALASRDVEVLFCAIDPDEPIAGIVGLLLGGQKGINARLLFGRQRLTANPKMDNVEKGYAQSRTDLVVFLDGNVMASGQLIEQLLDVKSEGTGLVSSPPVGVSPRGFWALVECAFLNTGFARMMLASDSLGAGFTHGKVFMIRKSLLEKNGGIDRLFAETAEDAAATKLVRKAGLRVRMARLPVAQPLGCRTFRDVWDRNARWAVLRRGAYGWLFPAEILTAGFTAIGMAWLLGFLSGQPVWALILAVMLVWYGAEWLLARLAGWPAGPLYAPACIMRDLLMPAVWLQAWFTDRYQWRGQTIAATRASREHRPPQTDQ